MRQRNEVKFIYNLEIKLKKGNQLLNQKLCLHLYDQRNN